MGGGFVDGVTSAGVRVTVTGMRMIKMQNAACALRADAGDTAIGAFGAAIPILRALFGQI